MSDFLQYDIKESGGCREKDKRKQKECMKYKMKVETEWEKILDRISILTRKYYV